MKGNCGECSRMWYCEISPDDCNEWPDPVPTTMENTGAPILYRFPTPTASAP